MEFELISPIPESKFFSSVQLSRSFVSDSATPQTAARQASLSITSSWSLPKLISIELVRPFNHLILCHPLLLPPSIFPSIRVFSNESVLCIRRPKYWSFSFNICLNCSYFIIFYSFLLSLKCVIFPKKKIGLFETLFRIFIYHGKHLN